MLWTSGRVSKESEKMKPNLKCKGTEDLHMYKKKAKKKNKTKTIVYLNFVMTLNRLTNTMCRTRI